MKAITSRDVCYSINATGNPMFNTDGVKRDKIDFEFGRSAIDFEIYKKQSWHYDERTGEIEKIPHHFHLVRDTDDAIVDAPSVGEQFTPVQHRDIFDYIMKEVAPQVPDMELEMVGTLHGLSTGVISFRVGDMFKVNGDKSPSSMRLLYANPCNGSGRLVMGFTTVRIVCQNTLKAAINQANTNGWRIKHTAGAELVAKDAVDAIKCEAQAANEIRAMSNVLAGIEVNGRTLKKALDRVYSTYNLEKGSPQYNHMIHFRQQVERQFDGGETSQTMEGKTAWTLFNSFTYPIFNEPKITRKTDLAQVAYRGMVGDVGERVSAIFRTVGQVTGAWE